MSPTDTRILIGSSWYPEMWPEPEWPRDLARMREIGFNIVRILEFAWHRLEPSEGRYDFDWARRVLDLCAEADIAVMIGTPTAAPPAWLTSKYPEVLQVGPDGSRASHGQRKHYSHHSPVYRNLCEGIVTRMAREFASHPALHSWQIDNEMSGADFSLSTRADFHRWIENRFGTIDALNAAWGLEFWSQAYERFDQIPMPTARLGTIEEPERHHPSLLMAVAEHRNAAWTDFIRHQADLLRNHSDKPITTNMVWNLGMDWFAHNRALDRVGHSLYRDVHHYAWNAPAFDRMRAEKPVPYWLLETAPSWSATGRLWNIHHDAQGVQAMAWLSLLMGGSMVLFWQWREHWAGQEMQHGVLVSATGKWRPNREAMRNLTTHAGHLETWLLKHAPPKAEVALVLSSKAAQAFSIDPSDDEMRYDVRWRDDYYLPLLRHHIWRDVIGPNADLTGYRLLLLPHLPIIPLETRARLRTWVEAGGHLVLGPYTGYRTEAFTAFRDRDFGGLEELIGAESALRFPVHWVEDKVTLDFTDAPPGRAKSLCEAWEPAVGTDIVARYRGGYGDGLAAVVRNRFGKGTVTTTGCRLDPESWWRLVQFHLDALSIRPLADASPDVVVTPRGSAGWGLVNLATEPRTLRLPEPGTDLIRNEPCGPELTLEPLGVRIIARQPA